MNYQTQKDDGVKLGAVGGHVVPVNVVLGEVGAGKTTVILGLVRQVAGPNCKVIWLKNEYGDVNVDGELARQQGIQTSEVMNGCLCCTAIGQLEDALQQILKLRPDRIIIETAGSAHPAPIAMELKRFPNLAIDSFVEVVDALNFRGFTDRTVSRRSYAQYVDFVVINKVGLVDERAMDEVIDGLNEVYDATPQYRTADGTVPSGLIFGLTGGAAVRRLSIDDLQRSEQTAGEHQDALQSFSWRGEGILDGVALEALVREMPPREIARVKGLVRTTDGWQAFNCVANRCSWLPLHETREQNELLFVGAQAADWQERVSARLAALTAKSV